MRRNCLAMLKFAFFSVAVPAASLRGAVESTQVSPPAAMTVSTGEFEIRLASEAGRLVQTNFGAPGGSTVAAPSTRPRARKPVPEDFYPAGGAGYIWEPAILATHTDGNTSTDLVIESRDAKQISPHVSETRINLKDPQYPFYVSLVFRSYADNDIIEQWSEIRHEESSPITLSRFASASPVFRGSDIHLTQFPGTYMREVNVVEEKLTQGTKTIESKLGTRAHYYHNPSFMLSLNGPASEETGAVIGGTLAWSGSFELSFEMEDTRVRALCGMNPYQSAYRLKPGETFRTPAMLWSFSNKGKGQISRNFHRWARQHALRNGNKPRPILLNNWEATGPTFNEPTIVALFDGAKQVGAELFLLDDGWFGNKHPRDDDKAGLGDWLPDARKLPKGVQHLADEATKRGLKFGIWVEPEMVNPKSELFEKHPDWVIQQPKRDPSYFRNQLVLDLTRPDVREFVFKCVDDLLTQNPGVAYIKWDCNRYISQPGSSYLKPDEQQNLFIDYNNALYDVMARVSKNHPNVQMMACAGGGGRVDYGVLRYFDGFWPSDNTDPLGRVKIQWGYSHFFPAAATCDHVTRKGNRPIKFAFDVAMSGCLGLDVDVSKYTAEERQFAAAATATYNTFREVILAGDLYRLESPDDDRTSLIYVTPDQSRAVLFVYQTKSTNAGSLTPLNICGLDPQRQYRIRELNLPAGASSKLASHDQVLGGSSLLKDGLVPPCRRAFDSAVIELKAE